MLYLGSAIFKIARLLFIAMLCVHFFACIFYRVKRDTAQNPENVVSFYEARYVDQDVRSVPCGNIVIVELSGPYLCVFLLARIYHVLMLVLL